MVPTIFCGAVYGYAAASRQSGDRYIGGGGGGGGIGAPGQHAAAAAIASQQAHIAMSMTKTPSTRHYLRIWIVDRDGVRCTAR